MNSFIFSNKQDAIRFFQSKTNLSYVVFACVHLVEELSELVGDNVILCSTSGEFTSEGYKENVITGFSYESGIAEIVELLYPPVKSISNIKQAYQKVKSNINAFALLLCDGLSAMEESIITTLYFIDPKFKIIGGSAGDNLKFENTLVYIGQKRVHSVAVFFNMKSRTQIIKENLYISTGCKLLVTEASPIKRIVKTFNNKPAAAEYAQALGVSEADLPDCFMNNPLGRISGEDVFITSPMKVNQDKSIAFYSQIIPNTFVEVLKPAKHTEIIQSTENAVNINPGFVLSINCILRSLLFKKNNLWKNIDSQLLSICRNQTGFISYGEQYYKNHLNQTMVLLLVE